MSVGFRPTEADNDIIQAHKRPDESTSDVLRRALRALDREKWQAQAREDMERITASGEDLSAEPDEWGYDETGEPVDLRGRDPQARRDVPRSDSEALFEAPMKGLRFATHSAGDLYGLGRISYDLVRDVSAAERLSSPGAFADDPRGMPNLHRVSAGAGAGKVDLLVHLARCGVADEAADTTQPNESTLANSGTGVFQIVEVKAFSDREAGSSSPATRRPGDSWKLAHLRALAARRDSER
jgi:hypothetical protein